MSSSTAPAPALPAAKKTRKGSRHDKSGCLTCRHRRKKCTDNTLPVCGACRRLNLECVREPIRNIVATSANANAMPSTQQHAISADIAAAPPLSAPMPVADSGSVDLAVKRHAMRYYMSVLTQLLTASEHFNSFLSAFLPMAMESTTLYEGLLALASGHLSLAEESYKVVALECRSVALNKLAAAISRPSNQITDHETNVAACLALVVGDVSTGNCLGWYAHLSGAKQIIVSAAARSNTGRALHGPEVFKENPEGRWILRNFAYHDIIGSVTMRRKPLLSPAYLDGITDIVDSYVGVATGLLEYISQINCLDEETRIDDCMTDEEVQRRTSEFHGTCAALEQGLLAWSCPPNAQEYLDSMAYTFRAAVLILLYRLARARLEDRGHGSASASGPWVRDMLRLKIRTQVYEILSRVGDIPPGATAESALLFPLFIAGGEATEDDQMEFVRLRLETTLQKRKFQNIGKALEILGDLWSLRKSRGGESVDWTQVLEASGGTLLLT